MVDQIRDIIINNRPQKAAEMIYSLFESEKAGVFLNIYDFSNREIEVLQLLSEGLNNKEIACNLGIAVRTVEYHKTNIYQKGGFLSGTEMAVYGIRHIEGKTIRHINKKRDKEKTSNHNL